MKSFFESFKDVMRTLYTTQKADTPAVLLEIFSKILRVGLLALCIAASLMLVQAIILAFQKKKRKSALFVGISGILVTGFVAYAFLPFSATTQQEVSSAALQNILYITAQEAAEQEAAEQAALEEAEIAEEVVEESETETEEETTVVDTGMKRTVDSQIELSQAQMSEIVALLESTECRRTLQYTLPEENGENVLLRLKNNKRWQVMMLEETGYVYPTEETGFICEIVDYDVFYSAIHSILG